LSIKVRYGEAEVEFSGSPEVVMRSLHEFVAKVIPHMDLARAISVNYSLNDLAQMFKDFVRVTPEGPRVWAGDAKLSDRDMIMLQLVAAKISNLSGRSQSDSMAVGEIVAATGVNPKTVSSRLSELTKSTHAERVETDSGGKYRLTTVGVSRLSDQLLKKPKPGSP
jgi:hypothetical protein